MATWTPRVTYACSVSQTAKKGVLYLRGGSLTWVPTASQTGSNTVTILAKDQFGDMTTQTFSIDVSDPDNPFAKRGFVGPVMRT